MLDWLNWVFIVDGEDVSEVFLLGVEVVVELVCCYDIWMVVFKVCSFFCGNLENYDGCFNGNWVVGEGVIVVVFKCMGVLVFNEDELDCVVVCLVGFDVGG